MTVRVLIVSTVFRRARILEKPLTDWGFDVLIATREADGLALCRQRSADIVLLEGIQPGLDGFAFCRALKDDESLRHLPIGLITDEREPRQRVQVLSAGADESFPFPMEQGPFLRRMRSLAALWELEDGLQRLLALSGPERPEGTDRVPILVLDPDSHSRERLHDILVPAYPVTLSQWSDEAISHMARERFGIVLCDLTRTMASGPMSSLLLHQLHLAGVSRRIGLIGIGEQESGQNAGTPVAGFCDVILRPVDRNEVLMRVGLAARKFRLKHALATLEAQLRPVSDGAADSRVLHQGLARRAA